MTRVVVASRVSGGHYPGAQRKVAATGGGSELPITLLNPPSREDSDRDRVGRTAPNPTESAPGLYNRTAVQAAEWFYIGHYGQLGPLTRDQIDELISGGVIAKDTYIWRTGMSDWLHAAHVPELKSSFAVADPFTMPPPPPTNKPGAAPIMPTAVAAPPLNPQGFGSWKTDALAPATSNMPVYGIKSDRSRVLAGILNLFLPGIGRIYLGHMAHGVLQLVLVLCFGVGYIWSFVDGIIILSGGVKYDGYGRVLTD